MALVHCFGCKLIAGVAAETEAVRGVFERGVHKIHAKDDDVSGVEGRGGPAGAEGFYDIIGVVGKSALYQVLVGVGGAVGIFELLVFVRA
mgnify:CR=1 FL=1